jgi:hypothetical protein
MTDRIARNRKLVTSSVVVSLVFAAVGVALATKLLIVDHESASASPDVFVSGGGPAFQGSTKDALALATSRSGFQIAPLQNPDYELRGIDLTDDVDGRRPVVQTVQMRYERTGSQPGDGRLTLYLLNGRQPAISAGREKEPPPVPESRLSGLDAVRVDLGASIGFTVWKDSMTYHFVFAPPQVTDSDMLRLIRDYLQ